MSSLPMPTPTVPFPSLTSFKVLAFDIYGTLIDWETSIVQHLHPLVSTLSPTSPYHDRIQLAARFNHHEHALQQEHPTMRYDNLLTETYLRLASEFNVPITESVKSDASTFGASIEHWQPFPDTVDAMKRLGKHYKLIPLSNVNKASFAKTCNGPLRGVPFWRIYVAEDIGSYKPDLRNFEYLITHADEDAKAEGAEEGVRKEEILMVAQSLMHDHVPAKKMGMSSVWINRKGAGMGNKGGLREMHERGEVGYAIQVGTLGELADLVDKAWVEEGGNQGAVA